MEDDGIICNTRLSLGRGIGGYVVPLKKQKIEEAIINKELICLKTRNMDDDEDDDHRNGFRKKLRLTKEQSTMLEDSFKLHSSLNPVSLNIYINILSFNFFLMICIQSLDHPGSDCDD